MTTLETNSTGGPRTGPKPRSARSWPFRPRTIGAVFKRNFLSYFSNPAGYVFITLFVFISSAVAFWQDTFFTNNLANLDQLNRFMPFLLLFFVPAITMNLWADERRQGTEELLLTLPAHDLDVVLGKYLAAIGIYTVGILFSLSHVMILSWLGQPDFGVLFATYLGYWLMGVMLIAVGMVASLLSSNVTVAFILGALFCAIPIFAGLIGSPLGGTLRRQVEDLSVPEQFADFGSGVIPLSGIFYFLTLAAAMLYLNMVLLGRRHWAGGESSKGRWVHSVARVVSIVLALTSLTVLVARAGVRFDSSAEKLHTLSPESIELLRQIPADKPVLIQAYYSPDVPRDYVETKADLLGLLKEYEARSGGKVHLNLVATELYSNEARDAKKRFDIEPRPVMVFDEGKQGASEIFLGVAFTAGLEEVVIPFFDRGLPVEYELTRSIRVVSKSGRKKVGILGTDAKMMGGMDMRSFSQSPEWSIVTELKKQYEVSSVSADSAIPTDLDVLLVAQPSSLTQKQIDTLTGYVKGGGPVLLFLDPFPVDKPEIAPEVPKMPPGGPFGGGQPPEQKGSLLPLLELLGIDWPTNEIVWNPYNPHPRLSEMPPEVVFISPASGAADAFNEAQVASSGLQEIVTLFPGLLRERTGRGLTFTPLLRTNDSGGIIAWNDVAQQGFMGVNGINPRRRHLQSGMSYTLAARVEGKAPAEPADATKNDETKKDEAKKEAEKPKEPATLKAIAIADLDLISEQFFRIRQQKVENLDFDNVTFVLNCVDVLAGDNSFVALRKKRPKHRTLLRLESESKEFINERQKQSKAAEDAAKEQLDQAQAAFNKEVDQVKGRTDLDDRTKEIMLSNMQDVAQRRLDVKKQNIEDEKLNKIRDGKADSEQKIRQIQNRVRTMAIIFPPLPPLILGLYIFIGRLRRENLGANPKRLA